MTVAAHPHRILLNELVKVYQLRVCVVQDADISESISERNFVTVVKDDYGSIRDELVDAPYEMLREVLCVEVDCNELYHL